MGPVPSCFGFTSGRTSGRCVYFLRDPGTGLVKIGTTRKLPARVRRIEWELRRGMELLLAFPGDYRVEHAIHRLLDAERERGEWFRPTARVMDAIAYWREHEESAALTGAR
jgi:hypothetical protein